MFTFLLLGVFLMGVRGGPCISYFILGHMWNANLWFVLFGRSHDLIVFKHIVRSTYFSGHKWLLWHMKSYENYIHYLKNLALFPFAILANHRMFFNIKLFLTYKIDDIFCTWIKFFTVPEELICNVMKFWLACCKIRIVYHKCLGSDSYISLSKQIMKWTENGAGWGWGAAE